MDTPKTTKLVLRNFESFNPIPKPGEKIDIRALGIAGATANFPDLNLQSTVLLDNPKTLENEGIKRIAEYLEKTYFKEHPDVLTTFGITDIHALTPKQAVQLASYIPIERVEYSKEQAKQSDSEKTVGAEMMINDSAPIDQLFQWGKDKSGNGVCRNYASIAIGVLESLKMLQDEKTSLIHNTYAINIQHVPNDELESVQGAVNEHAWNGFFTISQKGEEYVVDSVVLDSTWADASSIGSDPARIGHTKEGKLDYTRERFFTLAQKFDGKGLLPQEKYIPQLFENYKNSPSVTWESLKNEKEKDAIFSPVRLSIGYQLLNILNEMPKIPDALNTVVEDFLLEFSKDAESYTQCFDKITRDQKNPFRVEFEAIYPLTEHLLATINISKKMKTKIPASEKLNEQKQRLSRIITNFPPPHKNLTEEWNLALYNNYIQLADKTGEDSAIRQQTELFKNYIASKNVTPNYKLYLTEDIYRNLSPKGKEVFKESFPNIPFNNSNPEPESEKSKEKDSRHDIHETKARIKEKFNYSVDEEFPSNQDESLKYEEKIEKMASFLHSLEDALKTLPESEIPDKKINIYIRQGNERFTSLYDIYLNFFMTKDEVLSQISDFKESQKDWHNLQQICPCKIDLFGDSLTKGQLHEFLTNAKAYFSKSQQSLFQYKQIFIAKEDDISIYTKPRISVHHFLNKDFEKINALLATHDHKKYEKGLQENNLRKKFHDLHDTYKFLQESTVIPSDGNFNALSNYYDPLQKTLQNISESLQKPDFQKSDAEKSLNVLTKHPISLVIQDLSKVFREEGKNNLLDQKYPYYLVYGLNRDPETLKQINTIIAPNGMVIKAIWIKEAFTHDWGLTPLQHISLVLSEAKSEDEKINMQRENLKKSGNPIKITEENYKEILEMILLPGDKIQADPDPKGKVKQDGTVTLYSNNTPEEIGAEILRQTMRYVQFTQSPPKTSLNNTVLKIRELSGNPLTIDDQLENTVKRVSKILQENFKGIKNIPSDAFRVSFIVNNARELEISMSSQQNKWFFYNNS
ncbi:MAG: hypothetical protein WCJ84_06615 [Candidatus Peregrinibacteria bacterium]